MTRNEFYGITNDNIVSANKSAMRLLEKIKDKFSIRICRQLYFHFMEMHSIIYGKSNNHLQTFNDLKKCITSLKDSELFITDKNNPLYTPFWNTFITSNIYGEECTYDEFMKNLFYKYGKNNELVEFFNSHISNLYPDYSECEVKVYALHFVNYKNSVLISFKAKLESQEINSMLESLERYDIQEYGNLIKEYLINHHLEYYHFDIKEGNVDLDDLQLIHCACDSTDVYNESTLLMMNNIEDIVDEYYFCLSSGKWYDDYYKGYSLMSHINKLPNSARFKVKSVVQNYEIDENYQQWTGKLHILEFTTFLENSFKMLVDKNEIIIPEYSGKEVKILSNLNDINTIYDIQKYLK